MWLNDSWVSFELVRVLRRKCWGKRELSGGRESYLYSNTLFLFRCILKDEEYNKRKNSTFEFGLTCREVGFLGESVFSVILFDKYSKFNRYNCINSKWSHQKSTVEVRCHFEAMSQYQLVSENILLLHLTLVSRPFRDLLNWLDRGTETVLVFVLGKSKSMSGYKDKTNVLD